MKLNKLKSIKNPTQIYLYINCSKQINQTRENSKNKLSKM